MIPLPHLVADLCAALGDQRSVVAVALGGSRAAGTADAASDWDLGVYYRGGGAWLTLDGLKIDALLRDLGVVPHCTAQAVLEVAPVPLAGWVSGLGAALTAA